VSCFAIARDHQEAVAILLRHHLYASAFVLLRPLFEATVKGAWLAHSASDSDLEKHARGEELARIKDLVRDLSRSDVPREVSELLGGVKASGWQLFSSLNHAGIEQVRRWAAPTRVEPLYEEEEIEEIANVASLLGLVACLETARLSGDANSVRYLQSLLPATNSTNET